MKKTVQDFLVEIKSVKKTQMNGHLEMKKLGTKQGPHLFVCCFHWLMNKETALA